MTFSQPDGTALRGRDRLPAAQIDAGAQAVQLFDSWVGCSSRPSTTSAPCCRTCATCIDSVRGHGAPSIYFANGAAGMLPLVAQAGGRRATASTGASASTAAWAQLGDAAVQGNLDPAALLGPTKAIEERVADVLRQAGGRPGHVFNLGHGMLPEAPPEHVAFLVDAVHRLSARGGRRRARAGSVGERRRARSSPPRRPTPTI